MTTYADKLKHPKWQRKRLEIMSRDKFACRKCKDENTTLHIHHLEYKKGSDPWDYPNKLLITLCEKCHEIVEEFKKREDIDYSDLSIYKNNNWKDGSSIILIHYHDTIVLEIYDNSDKKSSGFILSPWCASNINSNLKKFINKSNKYIPPPIPESDAEEIS